MNEGRTERAGRRSKDRRPSAPRPSTSLNGRRPRPNRRRDGGTSAGVRTDGRNTKCAVGNQSGTLRRVRRPQTEGRTDRSGLVADTCPPSSPPSARSGSLRLPVCPPASLLPAWLFSAALSLTHCMVAPAAADAAAVLPPLHGQAAAVAEIRRAAGGHFGRLGGGCGVRKGKGRQAGRHHLAAG